MRLCTIFTVFLLLIFSLSQAQLILIQSKAIETNHCIERSATIVSFVNDSTALAYGLIDNDCPDCIYTILDTIGEPSIHYFILYKRGGIHDAAAISRYGSILHDESHYCIFKTSLHALHDFDTFLPYDIIQFETDPIVYNKPQRHSPPVVEKIIPGVKDIVSTISIDSIWQRLALLQKMERYTSAAGAKTTAKSFKNYIAGFDWDTTYEHTWGSGSPNVVAEKKGTTIVDEICIVGGHYDVTQSMYPGADDNGSGTAACMEIARVLNKHSFKRTIHLVLFSGEESGLGGSKAYASTVAGKDVIAVFNMDMISYLKKGDPLALDVVCNTSSRPLFETFSSTTKLYVPNTTICDAVGSPWANASDHKSFWDKGFQALYFGDDLDPNGPAHPCYHQKTDTIGYGSNSKEYCEKMVKSVLACLITKAELDEVTSTVSKIRPISEYTILQSRGSLTLLTPSAHPETVKLQIYNCRGLKILSQAVNAPATIDIAKFPPGYYTVHLTNVGSNDGAKPYTLLLRKINIVIPF